MDGFPGRVGALRRAALFLTVALAAATACDATGADANAGLVFVRAVDGAGDLAQARIRDGAVRALTSTPGRAERWPYWSSRARRLVYQVSPRGVPQRSNLVLLDPRSSSQLRLPPTADRQERWPAWAPDGRHLAYAFLGGKPAAGVALVDLADHTSHVLASISGDGFFLRPAFAPAGDWLVAERRDPEAKRSSIWRISPGTRPVALSDHRAWNDSKPEFSASGAQIFFTRRPADGGPADVMRMPAGGGDAVPVVASAADEHSARPSPVRNEIAFVSDSEGVANVFIADMAGGGIRNLHRTKERHLFAPRWSPDGNRIAVTSMENDGRGVRNISHRDLSRLRVMVFDREGALLLDTPGAMPDWMPPWR